MSRNQRHHDQALRAQAQTRAQTNDVRPDIEAALAGINKRRVNACRKSLARFLKTYFAETFYSPWSEPHKRAIEKIEYSLEYGGLFALAMPRGDGKSSIVKGAAVWALLYEFRRFVVLIGATEAKARKLLKEIKSYFRFNDKLAQDFPRVCIPIRRLQGIAKRSESQHYGGEPTMIGWGSDTLIFPWIDGEGPSGSLIEVAGLTGDVRGKTHTRPDGTVIRPDFVIPDDPQTKKSAKSETQCEEREDIINSDVLGLAGPDQTISGVMPCTIVCVDDVAARFLDHDKYPDWQGEVTALFEHMPANTEAWDEYNEVRKRGITERDKGKAANDYYRDNREKLDEGTVVTWEARKDDSELSAIQHGMNLYYKLGRRAFMAEYQNDPLEAAPALYEISADIVCSRTNGLARYDVPAEAQWLVAFIDINYRRSGLHYVVAGIANDLTGWICDHGRYPQNEREELWTPGKDAAQSPAQAIYGGLSVLVPDVFGKPWTRGGSPVALEGMLIDCGFEQDTVLRFIAQVRRAGRPVLPSRGRNAQKYRLPGKSRMVGRPGNNQHVARWQGKGTVVVHQTDYWRTHAQKAFLLAPGAPGSFSLWGNDGEAHRKFGQHMAAERLVEFKRGDVSDYYNWHQVPGQANDLLDCTVGCCVAGNRAGAEVISVESAPAAAVSGGPAGEGQPQPQAAARRPRPRRKVRRSYSVPI